MSIFPRADSRLSWWKRIGIYFLMWITWIMPAFADSADDYLNDSVRGLVTMITIFGILLSLVPPLLGYFHFGKNGWNCIAFGVATYLVVGLIYYAQDKWGPYS